MKLKVTQYLLCLAVGYSVSLLAHADVAPQDPPALQHVFDAQVVSVYDGDTLTVQPLPPKINIRLLDCWAAEIRGKVPEEKERGIKARDYLRSLLKDGDIVRVQVPLTSRLTDAITFDRVLARVWSSEGADASIAMVRSGHATKLKP